MMQILEWITGLISSCVLVETYRWKQIGDVLTAPWFLLGVGFLLLIHFRMRLWDMRADASITVHMLWRTKIPHKHQDLVSVRHERNIPNSALASLSAVPRLGSRWWDDSFLNEILPTLQDAKLLFHWAIALLHCIFVTMSNGVFTLSYWFIQIFFSYLVTGFFALTNLINLLVE